MDSGGACHVVRRHQTIFVDQNLLNSVFIDLFKVHSPPGTPGYCYSRVYDDCGVEVGMGFSIPGCGGDKATDHGGALEAAGIRRE